MNSPDQALRRPAPPDLPALMRLSSAYWESQTLLTANRIGLFELLARDRPLGAEGVAAALGVKARPARLLLKACVALGLVEEVAEGFRNAPLSSAFLVPGGPAYLGQAMRYMDDMYRVWGDLEQTLREDRPALRPDAYLGEDPDQTRHFVHGMHNRALGVGRVLADLVDLSGKRRMLDVGGGPGTYSALFVQRYPQLRCQVLELPKVAALAREILASMGVGERVEMLPGDYRSTPFPAANDAVLISGVFHRESVATCGELIERACESLVPEGLLIVSDVFSDAGGAGPLFATLFGLNMMLSAQDGGVHADTDVADWLSQAGLENVEIRRFPPPMPHRLVLGRKRAEG